MYEVRFLQARPYSKMPSLKTAASLKQFRRDRAQTEGSSRAVELQLNLVEKTFKRGRVPFLDNLVLSGWKLSLLSGMACLLQTTTLKEDCKRRKGRFNLSELRRQQCLRKSRKWNSYIEISEQKKKASKNVAGHHFFAARDHA